VIYIHFITRARRRDVKQENICW